MHDYDLCVAPGGANRFDHVDALLQRYPDISEDELDDLKRWFVKEASAFEIASLSSKDATSAGYRRFRSEHIDPFNASDLLKGAAMLACLVAIVALIWLLKA